MSLLVTNSTNIRVSIFHWGFGNPRMFSCVRLKNESPEAAKVCLHLNKLHINSLLKPLSQ